MNTILLLLSRSLSWRRALMALVLGMTFLGVGVAGELYCSHSSFIPVPIFFHGPSYGRVVALTFDDGPDPRWTPGILRTLKSQHVPATFFLVGKSVETYPALARAERDSGCEIGNHSWDHQNLRWLEPGDISLEMDRTQAAIRRAAGVTPRLFRPPYGDGSPLVWLEARHRGMQTVLWSMSPWHGRSPRPEDLVYFTLRDCRPGSVILLHDGRLNRSQTVKALPVIIARLRARGYHFVTISQMQRSRQT